MFRAQNTGAVDPVELSIIDTKDEATALYKVQKLIQRDQYILIKVWECNQCEYQNRIINIFKKLGFDK